MVFPVVFPVVKLAEPRGGASKGRADLAGRVLCVVMLKRDRGEGDCDAFVMGRDGGLSHKPLDRRVAIDDSRVL